MDLERTNYQEYWDKRYESEGKIWGEQPSLTAKYAAVLFQRANIQSILVPGSGYGRHTKFLSESGFNVTGIEISATALNLAYKFDLHSRFYQSSVLDMSFDNHRYDGIFCFNLLHLFLEKERRVFIAECERKLEKWGGMFFSVFSEKETSYGEGREVEKNTFESRPGRPAHYFTEEDLKEHFAKYNIVESGIMEDPEDHGGKPHTHFLRYIYVTCRSGLESAL
jgi:SAM-dependent methyltransferase